MAAMLDIMLGSKIKQTQQYSDSGWRMPLTYIKVGPCYVTGLHKDVNDKPAIQLGFGQIKNLKRPQEGELKKAGLTDKLRFFRSFSYPQPDPELSVGMQIQVDKIFKIGDKVNVTGISKGKGFAGGVKRYHFKGGPHTHGQSDRERAPGSIGQTTTPGRVYRGKRMAGRMGSDRITVKNLQVVSIDSQNQIIGIKGLIPGGKDNLIIIKKS